jgi:hydrogenase 3 maturation protease
VLDRSYDDIDILAALKDTSIGTFKANVSYYSTFIDHGLQVHTMARDIPTGQMLRVSVVNEILIRPWGLNNMVMNMLLGIGNALRGDDGIGVWIARNTHVIGWKALDCGPVPENFTGIVRREHPDLLLLVDAADMGLAPGEFRIIPQEKIQDVGIGTHQLPLSHLITFLEGTAGTILFIGIQPACLEEDMPISPDVKEGAMRLIAHISKGTIREIPPF